MRTDKPWGFEELLSATNMSGVPFNNKILVIVDGQQTSLHYHENRDEMIFVHEGILNLIRSTGIEQVASQLSPGETVWIPHGDVHRLGSIVGQVTLFESSIGDLRDIIRVEDDYGREDDLSKHIDHDALAESMRKKHGW